MKRAVIAAVFAATVVALGPAGATSAGAAGRLIPEGPLLVSVVQNAAVAWHTPAALGTAVNPASRDARAFLIAVSSGGQLDGLSGNTSSALGMLIERLASAGIVATADGPRSRLLLYGLDFHGAGRSTITPALRVTDQPDPAAGIQIWIPPDGRTPLDVRVARPAWALLNGGQSRRPAIVTPADLTATILSHFDIAPPRGLAGRALRAEPHQNPFAASRAIAGRMVRDVSFMQSLTAWTVGIGLGFGWLVAWPMARAGRRRLATRLTTGASFVTVGFLMGLMIPSARGDVRALPMFALFLAGTLIRWRDPEAVAMRAFVVAAGVTAVLAVLAAADPGGFAATALWGNPLVSWRLFGLQNFATAFIAGGAVVAATRLGLRALPLGLLSGALLIVVGSPRIGANFVAVLTFAFGAAFAVAAVRRGSLRPSMIAIAAGIALAAFALALASDAAGVTSHGGAAARQIGRGGIVALWDLTYDRLRLNVGAINAFPGGWAWVALFVGLYAAMIRDAFKRDGWPDARRVAIAAGALSGLAALCLEDSGFKTTAVLGFPALLLWTFARTGGSDPSSRPSAPTG